MPKLGRVLMNEIELKRFRSHIKLPESPEDCWIWTAAHGGSGMYAQYSIERAPIRASRASYEYFIGIIPNGYQVDHLCFNRSCVNPEHLEAVTPAVNTQRSRARKTHCKDGHPLSGDNLYICPRGYRECLTCRRAAVKRHRGVT